MADPAERLLTVIEAESELYRRLRDLLQEERELLLGLDAVRLEELTRRKSELIDEGRVLESCRQAVVAQIATELGLPTEGLRLSALCERLGPALPSLRAAHNDFVVVVSVVRELLEANRSLAGRSLADVRTTLEALGGLVVEHPGYSPDGREHPRSGRLLREAI